MHPRLSVANGGETLGETKKLCISCKHTGRFEEQHVVSQQKYAYKTSGATFTAESKFGSSAALSTRTAKGEPKLTRVFNKLPQEKQSFAPETSYLAVQVHRKGVHRKGIKQHGRADKMASGPELLSSRIHSAEKPVLAHPNHLAPSIKVLGRIVPLVGCLQLGHGDLHFLIRDIDALHEVHVIVV